MKQGKGRAAGGKRQATGAGGRGQGQGSRTNLAVERRAGVLGAPREVEGLKRGPPTEVGGLNLEFRVLGF